MLVDLTEVEVGGSVVVATFKGDPMLVDQEVRTYFKDHPNGFECRLVAEMETLSGLKMTVCARYLDGHGSRK